MLARAVSVSSFVPISPRRVESSHWAARTTSAGASRRGHSRMMSEGEGGVAKFRVNRVLCEKFSRREADRFVTEGRIKINGRTAVPGDMVGLDDAVQLDGRHVPFPVERLAPNIAIARKGKAREKRQAQDQGGVSAGLEYIVYHKPRG